LHHEAGKMIAAQFLRNLVAAVPYAIHTMLTDNGIQFANQARHKYAFHHIFDRVCDEDRIEHRLTKIKTSLDQRPVRQHSGRSCT
jgi:RNA-directed DNA polymerase